MPIAPWAWCAWRVAVARGLVGEELGRRDLEPRRARLGGTHRGGERDRHDHRLLGSVDEVRLHGLEGADRLAELATLPRCTRA